MNIQVANPWRGETLVKCGDATIKLRCRIETLAVITTALDCETLIEVFRKWDGLAPDVMEKTLGLLAQNPSDAKPFWNNVNGMRGLQELQVKFYEVTSGQTPDEVAAEDDSRKKLEAFIAAKTTEQTAAIVEALNL